MKQFSFEAVHQPFWDKMLIVISELEQGKKLSMFERTHFARDYRDLCYHLALAQSRTYSGSLVDYLQILVERGHRQFYRHKDPVLSNFWQFVRYDFPDLVREQWRFILAAHLLFYIPCIGFGVMTYFYPAILNDLFGMDPEALKEQYVEMYQGMADSHNKGTNRELGDDWFMFAFYVFNNIGISFQMFAGGLALGFGTLYTLFYNGLMIGSVFGLMADTPVATTFFSFVIAHGAFELTGIVLAGAAGLKLGWILLKPGSYSRLDALKRQGKPAIQIMSAGFLFLFIAAIVEGFWSPITTLPYTVKFIVGIVLWLLVYAYMLLLGKNNEA